jgi:hypothetical protein
MVIFDITDTNEYTRKHTVLGPDMPCGMTTKIASLCLRAAHTAITIMIEGRFQVFQQFSSSKLVLKTVESCFAALNYYGNGSRTEHVKMYITYKYVYHI